MTLAMAKLYNSIGRVNDGSNGIYMLRNKKYNMFLNKFLLFFFFFLRENIIPVLTV